VTKHALTAVAALLVTASGLALVSLAAGASGEQSPTKLPSDIGALAPTKLPSEVGGRKTWVHPKTPWGDPDLQGMWPSGDMTGVPLERPEPFGPRARLTDEEFAQRQTALTRQYQSFVIGAWGEQGKAQRQASLIVDPPDGRMPAMTAEGQKRSANVHSSWQNRPFDSVDDFDTWDRCITRGLPPMMFPVQYSNGLEIVQGPGYVTIRIEMIHETRIIPLDTRPRLGSAIKQWAGDSRGRWEGNALVVETSNFNGKTAATNPGTSGSPAQNNIPTSESLRLVERFTRVDPDTINYEVTIDDPIVFTAPWMVAYPLRRHPEYVIFEYACHETNYALRNLITGSQAERAAAALERPLR
jgi:hypothetical protein